MKQNFLTHRIKPYEGEGFKLLLLIKTRLLNFLCCDIWMDFGYFSNIRAIGNCMVRILKYYGYYHSKYKLSQINVQFEIESIFYAIFRNFGGMTGKDCEEFLFREIYQPTMLNSGTNNSERMVYNSILEQFSTSSLINSDIKLPCACEICLVMIMSDTSLQSHSLTDGNTTNIKNNKIFGIRSQLISQIKNHAVSMLIVHQKELMHHSIRNGIILVLLKLEQLHDSLYGMLDHKKKIYH